LLFFNSLTLFSVFPLFAAAALVFFSWLIFFSFPMCVFSFYGVDTSVLSNAPPTPPFPLPYIFLIS